MTSFHRCVTAILCAFVLSHGAWAQCGGWGVSAESRRACCQNGCHSQDTDGSQGALADQNAADRCCATAEGGAPASDTPPFTLGTASPVLQQVLPIFAPALTVAAIGHELTGTPPRTEATPKHLLLSVFLI